MIELIQFPWSPFCLVQSAILDFAGVAYKKVNVPPQDRSLVWRLTRQRYYGVPIVRDGRNIIFELNDESQVIAKYIDAKYELGLFPAEHRGVQAILWRYIENEVEGMTFRLNDIYFRENCSVSDQLPYLRYKERKFGRGCIDDWRAGQKQLVKNLEERLLPFESMVAHRPFLLDDRPRFVDFDLFGMLNNYLYTGHYRLPKAHAKLRAWHSRMTGLKFDSLAREKLHS